MSQSKVEILNFNSNILSKEMKVFVYLPEGYDNLTPLSVLYFLHGRSGNENIMFELDIKSKADKMIKNREINPMIMVCPRMENSRGLNSSL
ncbi:MAG: alpha/beta hydrolase-fold protein, partial [Paeniclostridium sordellii]|nr:alpha/beta hydrolase-fold protein [Paeniclostridium sordellii]